MPYLNLQQIIAADTLVVHLMVGIISIAATLVFNKGKAKRFRLDR